MQNLLNVCSDFSNLFDVNFNSVKSKCVIFKDTKVYVGNPVFVLNGTPLEVVSNIKYLGMIICNDLSDDMELSNMYRKLCCRSNMLSRKFNLCSVSIKNELFRVYCSSIYGIAVLSKFKKSSFRKLEICYNNAFRILHRYHKYCSASEMFVFNNINSFREVWRANQLSIYQTAVESRNLVVTATFGRIHTPLWTKIKMNLFLGS